MIWEHVRAFLWLQSRIRANKSKRSGQLTLVIHSIAVVVGIAISVASFFGMLALGYFLLKEQPTRVLLYVWDGVILVFLMVWLMVLSVELQRSELLPIEKFMHFPISISGLFLINYTASILGETVAICFFFPAMFGLTTGLLLSRGAAMLWLFPLVASFILMVTAITYQFRGWLAVLMMNKRHRRTIITVVTFMSMIIFQFPYLSGRIFGKGRVAYSLSHLSQPEDLLRRLSMIVPPGWVGYGAMSSAEGRFLPALFGIFGMLSITALSLRRSYRTTLRLYTGNYGFGKTKARSASIPAPTTATRLSPAATMLLERKLPWVSEQTAAVALANLRSLTRAPEAKMMLVSPLILLLFFGASISRWSAHPSEFTRPLVATGVLMMLYLTVSQLLMNQFGFDRHAFRNYVLSSAPRREVLMGKNLASAPLTIGLALLAMAILEWVFPMRIDHFLGVLFQAGTMFFLMSIFANFVSILNPTAIASGSLKPAVRPSGKTILFGMLILMLYPVAMAPSMIPLGLEFAFHWLGWNARVPVFLILSAVEFAAAAGFYYWVIEYQGRLLQSREISILEVVAGRASEE